MPLGCPQDSLDEYTEDCLSMVLYVPTTATVSASMPILMWFVSDDDVFSEFPTHSLQDSRRLVLLWIGKRRRSYRF